MFLLFSCLGAKFFKLTSQFCSKALGQGFGNSLCPFPHFRVGESAIVRKKLQRKRHTLEAIGDLLAAVYIKQGDCPEQFASSGSNGFHKFRCIQKTCALGSKLRRGGNTSILS